MKRVSLIVATGLVAFGFRAARAEDGATSVEVIPPGGTEAAPAETPPAAGAPGSVQTAPAGSAAVPSGADVDVTPPAPAPRVTVVPGPVQPVTRAPIMPQARPITANTAAIWGGVTEPALPVRNPPPPPQLPVDHGAMHDTNHVALGRVGVGLLVGGGYEDFTNSTMRSQTGGGGSWNARAVAGTRRYLGAEAAYVGAARSVDALGVASNAVLVSNGVEGDLRLNMPLAMRRAQLLEPFGFAGLGWQHYAVTNTNVNTSDLARNDDVMTVPVGAGLAYSVGRFMADARFTYRSTFYNDLMRTGGSLSNWGVGGQLGASF